MFIKNFTYDTKFRLEDGNDEARPITTPLFVVLDIEPFPYGEAGKYRTMMFWIAGFMVLFGLLFYLVLIRGGQKQQVRMEAHRMELRKRIRAKGQVPELPKSKDEVPPEDD